METTTIDIPTELLIAAKITPQEVKTELARQFFKQGRISEPQARQLAGDTASLQEMFLKKEPAGHIDMAEFISWAAHDLKSPLNAVIGFTKVVLKGIDGPVNEIQVTDLTSAHSNGQRMLLLTNNLIDMARLNTGELHIEKSLGDLAQTISEAANRWKTQNPNKVITAAVNINQPGCLYDGMRMRQVLNGLLTYAANHIADGGNLNLRAHDNDREIVVEIESSGQKARDKYEMDLAMIAFICQGLISLHAGHLTIGNDTGSGLGLSFTLPKA